MDLRDLHQTQGAELAADGIPLHYGDLKAEYHTALERVILLDRSHEGRIAITGRDRFAVPHRMSTNDLLNMAPGEGRPTIFTNANARILDRAMLYNRTDEALLIGEPGRGAALLNYLQRNIFFNDQLRLSDRSTTTHQFALHGPLADHVVEALIPGSASLPPLHGTDAIIDGSPVFVARRKPLSGSHWVIVTPAESAAQVWLAVTAAGQPHGLIPAGSLTFNTLRIRAGCPASGRELSPNFIPLEIGLWDEISFRKGCYIGQEIIARMESRNRLARIMVKLALAAYVESPEDMYADEQRAGTLTSSVVSPDGEIFGIGVVKTALARPGQQFTVGETQAAITGIAGVQPAQFASEEVTES